MIQRLLKSRRFQRTGKRLIFALCVACFISFSLLLTFVGKQSKNTLDHDHDIGTALAKPGGVTNGLDVHIWRMQCGSNVTYLRKSPFFPKYPDERKVINDFEIEDDRVNYGQKIFGYLHPQSNGLFYFAITSDDTSELWISTDENPGNKRLVARVFIEKAIAWTGKDELDKYPEQKTKKPLYLQANKKYYVEVLHKQGSGKGFARVFWTTSDKDEDFRLITSEYLSPFLPSTLPTGPAKKVKLHNLLSRRYRQEYRRKSNLLSSDFLKFYSLPFVLKDNFLPSCDYKSSFVTADKVDRYEGMKMVFESNVFPPDDTQMSNDTGVVWTRANRAADKEIIQSVVDDVVTTLRLKSSE